MNVTLASGDAANALKVAGMAISAKPNRPILKNVLITVNSKVKFAATDMDTSIEYSAEGSIGKEGVCCVEADTVLQLVSAMDDKSDLQIVVSGDGNKVAFLHGRSVYKIPSLKPEDYPSLEVVKDEDKKVELEIPFGELKEYIRRTVFAVLQDATKPSLTGECWKIGEEESMIAATDTHRLVVMKLPAYGHAVKESFILPAKALNFIRNMMGEDSDDVRIVLSENLVSFETPSWRLVNRLISGKYPDVRRVIPGEHSVVWRIPTASLASALRRIRVLTKDHKTRADMTIFSGSGETLKITAVGFDSGEGSEEVDMTSEGEELTIALNAKLVVDALSACDDMVEVRMTEPMKPAVLVSGEGWQTIIMPMQQT